MTRMTYILLFLMIGCNKDKADMMLQQNEVPLVEPRIIASNKIIDSTVTLKAEFMMDEVQIFFTDDGTEPTKKSPLYKAPIIVSEPKTFKFKAFHAEWKPSSVAEINFVKKGHDIDSIIWLNTINEKYDGQGSRTLINHTKASNNFMNQEWMGFDEPVGVVCMFKEKTHISSIDIGYLNSPGAWILPPKKITVYTSSNGIDFVEISRHELAVPDQVTDALIETYSIPFDKEVNGLKLEVENISDIPDWHEGKGNKAWLFMDEIIFNK